MIRLTHLSWSAHSPTIREIRKRRSTTGETRPTSAWKLHPFSTSALVSPRVRQAVECSDIMQLWGTFNERWMLSVGKFDYRVNRLRSFATNSSSLLAILLSLTSLIYQLWISNLSHSTQDASVNITILSSPPEVQTVTIYVAKKSAYDCSRVRREAGEEGGRMGVGLS